MGVQDAAQQYADDINTFVKETADKWSAALTDIGAGNYTSGAFQNDVVETVKNAVTYLWLPLFGFIGAPPLPVAIVKGTVADVTSAIGVVTDQPLDAPFDAGSLAPSATLVLLGNPTQRVDCVLAELGAPQPNGVRVTVQLPPPPAPAPQTGSYYGVASAQVNGTPKIVAMILLTITP